MLPLIFGIVCLIVVMLVEPRSLWSGAAVLALLFGMALSALFLLFRYLNWMGHHAQWLLSLIVILGSAALVILMMFPLLLAFMFLVEGVRLIRREGFSLSNCLSLGFSFFIILTVFVLPALALKIDNPRFTYLFTLASIVVGYFSTLLALYVLSAFVNLLHLRRKAGFDQIVVLGSGIMGTRVPPLLASRIQEGILLQKKNPNALLILSGGQGPGEDIPEGVAMKAWALEHGADPARTVSEEASKNTFENLMLSCRLFPKPGGKTAIVTTRYHVFRALLLARSLGIPCKGYGSKTKWYFTLNAMLREYAAYLSETWKKQARILFFILLPFLFYGLINLIFNTW